MINIYKVYPRENALIQNGSAWAVFVAATSKGKAIGHVVRHENNDEVYYVGEKEVVGYKHNDFGCSCVLEDVELKDGTVFWEDSLDLMMYGVEFAPSDDCEGDNEYEDDCDCEDNEDDEACEFCTEDELCPSCDAESGIVSIEIFAHGMWEEEWINDDEYKSVNEALAVIRKHLFE
jgi:hypothetical protein